MRAFHHTVDIDASPDDVWAVLGDLSAVDRWIPGVTAVELTGDTRLCTFADGHRQREQILDYSAHDRAFSYVIHGSPLPVTANTGRFAVEASGLGTRVVWDSSFEPVDPAAADELAAMWEPYLPLTLANLKQLVEGCRPRP